MAEFDEVFAAAKIDAPDMQLEVLGTSLNVPALSTPQDSPFMAALQASCESVTGQPAAVLPFPGSTDAPNYRGQSLICGPGDLAQCHSLNEYVAIDEIVAAVTIYEQTLRALQP